MSQSSAPTRATNLPLILLWVASVAVGAIGYLLMSTSITAQSDFYTAGGQEPLQLLSAQTYTTLGTTLIGVGVLGLLIAIAVHAHNFALAQAQAALMINDFDTFGADFAEESEVLHSTSTPAAAAVVAEEAVIVEAPVVADAPAAPAAPAVAPTDEKPATPAS